MTAPFYARVVGAAVLNPAAQVTAGIFEDIPTPTNALPRAVSLLDGSFSNGFFADLASVTVSFTDIAGATQSRMKITLDAAGDIPLTPISSWMPIVTGETTAATGSVVFNGGFSMGVGGTPPVLGPGGRVVVFVWVDVNAGTAGISSVTITTFP